MSGAKGRVRRNKGVSSSLVLFVDVVVYFLLRV